MGKSVIEFLKKLLTPLRIIFSRAAVTLLLIAAELFTLFVLFKWLQPHIPWIEGLIRLAAAATVIYLASRGRHPSSDMMWVVVILVIPVGGILVYAIVEGFLSRHSRTYVRIREETASARKYYRQDEVILRCADSDSSDYPGQIRSMVEAAGFPVYENRGYRYFPNGETALPAILAALERAEKFIFLEVFTIEPGKMWDAIRKVLQKKAQQGVEIRVMYDDMGSFQTLPACDTKELEESGIRAMVFNRVNPVINGIMNHRDHRKILVIDGKTAFTGGINIADQYINETHPYGYWKDNSVEMTGNAVWSFTVMFLTLWNALNKEDTDYRKYRAELIFGGKTDGWIIPYADTPLDDRLTAQDIYLNILNQARNYCYIFTPYLVIDNEMRGALTRAAQRGVDVALITPGIPDKKLIYDITRSHYRGLIAGGVKIFEYTPGFDHAKVFVCDDVIATVGSINLDYRSLYLHFEDGTYLYGSAEVHAVRDDLREAMAVSHPVTYAESRISGIRRIGIDIVSIFAPLM